MLLGRPSPGGVVLSTSMQPPAALSLPEAGSLAPVEVLTRLGSAAAGLSSPEAARRLQQTGPNAVRTHEARAVAVLGRQLRSPLLALLAATATVSFFVGERTDSLIIGAILTASVGLGVVNEYRAERASAALHSQIRHHATVVRDGHAGQVDVTGLVPGDVVRLRLGEIVPADLRLLEVTGLETDESVLTGESLPVTKTVEPLAAGAALADLTCCAPMGTVVHRGAGEGVVVATGAATEFGRIALELGERQPETEFQRGLRHFSGLLLGVAVVLTVSIFVINLLLHHPLIDALLFSLAIAVGITPQLLPAVVSTSLATGSRQLARHKVLVKRLVCIEDLGDIDLLVTDKTGTLTEGAISFVTAIDPEGRSTEQVLALGLLGIEATAEAGANPLDAALARAPGAAALTAGHTHLDMVPFDHERRMSSALVRTPAGEVLLVTKGAPESVLGRCVGIPPHAEATLQAQFATGARVVAVASRPTRLGRIGASDECDLSLC